MVHPPVMFLVMTLLTKLGVSATGLSLQMLISFLALIKKYKTNAI